MSSFTSKTRIVASVGIGALSAWAHLTKNLVWALRSSVGVNSMSLLQSRLAYDWQLTINGLCCL